MSDSEKKKRKKGDDSDEEEKKLALKVSSYTDIQRFKLDKLMKDPSKPAFIPERRSEKNVNVAPEFNHNIMGSSAGAGSGEFHLYRQMRRKEQNRMKVLGLRQERDELNDAYHAKLEENAKQAEEKTAKKRKKRQKKKERQKMKKKDGKNTNDGEDKSDSSEAEEESEDESECKQNSDKPSETATATCDDADNSVKATSDLKTIENTDKNDKNDKNDKKGMTLVFYQ